MDPTPCRALDAKSIPSRRRAALQHAPGAGLRGRPATVAGSKLREHPLHVALDGVHAHIEAFGNLLVGEPLGQEGKDLELALGKARGTLDFGGVLASTAPSSKGRSGS